MASIRDCHELASLFLCSLILQRSSYSLRFLLHMPMYYAIFPLHHTLFQTLLRHQFSMVTLRESSMVKSILFFNISVLPHQIEFFNGGDHLYQFLACSRCSTKVWIIYYYALRDVVTSSLLLGILFPVSAMNFFFLSFYHQTLIDRLLTIEILNYNFLSEISYAEENWRKQCIFSWYQM